MTIQLAYDTDLAYIHDRGFGDFARGAAPGLVSAIRNAGFSQGRTVDLGCGSGIWARELIAAGYQVTGVDISPAMIAIARARVPDGEFHVDSFVRFPFPPCSVITALGEVFNYLFDADHSLATLEILFRRAFDALAPSGLLIFDVAAPGRCLGRTQAFSEGPDWVCLVEYQHDELNQRLTRRIVTFRKIDNAYRRTEETHRQQLLEPGAITAMLEAVGFSVRVQRSYGDYALPKDVAAFVAQRSP